jgi:hypothetical protein
VIRKKPWFFVHLLNFLNVFVCPFLTGKNPSKQKRSQGIPEFTNAGTNAVAPGKLHTSIPAFTQALTNKNPGSDMPGVPASVINAISIPVANFIQILSNTLCSLC